MERGSLAASRKLATARRVESAAIRRTSLLETQKDSTGRWHGAQDNPVQILKSQQEDGKQPKNSIDSQIQTSTKLTQRQQEWAEEAKRVGLEHLPRNAASVNQLKMWASFYRKPKLTTEWVRLVFGIEDAPERVTASLYGIRDGELSFDRVYAVAREWDKMCREAGMDKRSWSSPWEFIHAIQYEVSGCEEQRLALAIEEVEAAAKMEN